MDVLNELMNPIQSPHFTQEDTAVQVEIQDYCSWSYNYSGKADLKSATLSTMKANCSPQPKANLTSLIPENSSPALTAISFES